MSETFSSELARKRTWNSRRFKSVEIFRNFATQMFKLIILHKNNTDTICQSDGEEAKSISLTKHDIFLLKLTLMFSVS